MEIEAGSPVAIVYPDQREGEVGTLFIPNTLAVVKGAPNKQRAQKLIEYLLKAENEGKLAQGPSAQIPLHIESTTKARVETPKTIRAMQVDFEAAAEGWSSTYEFLRDEFTGAK